MSIENIVSVSGGKDSTATVLLAMALETENLQLVFADTGHEHRLTYEYLDYLEDKLSLPIRRVKADFSAQIDRKRQKLIDGVLPGWTDAATARALEVLKPTGNPFLDLCMWKGRFPSSQARFCTEFLKTDPIVYQVFFPLMNEGKIVWSWQGVRRDESLARRYVPEFEEVADGRLCNYRPIARWNVESVFEAHRYMGVDPNPLYKMGMGRVGCMPCVNCSKDELAAIALRCPEEVDRVREWEALASQASRQQNASFFSVTNDPTVSGKEILSYKTHGIDRMVEWSQTVRGGRQFDLIATASDSKACSSAYGLCDGVTI